MNNKTSFNHWMKKLFTYGITTGFFARNSHIDYKNQKITCGEKAELTMPFSDWQQDFENNLTPEEVVSKAFCGAGIK